MGKLLFVTGTDTGVGKTVFTSALSLWLRKRGIKAWALKPFCSGDRHDAELFFSIQEGELPLDVVNPCYFATPLAPYVAARCEGQRVNTGEVVRIIKRLQSQVDWLLVEGCGGLLVPVSRGKTVLDLIRALDATVVVVGANRLGVINQTLLTVRTLLQNRCKVSGVCLMQQETPDLASESNAQVIEEFAPSVKCFVVRYLGNGSTHLQVLKKNLKKVEKTLAQFWNGAIVAAVRERKAR